MFNEPVIRLQADATCAEGNSFSSLQWENLLLKSIFCLENIIELKYLTLKTQSFKSRKIFKSRLDGKKFFRSGGEPGQIGSVQKMNRERKNDPNFIILRRD